MFVFKYPLEITDHVRVYSIPAGAKLVHVGVQQGLDSDFAVRGETLCLWAEVEGIVETTKLRGRKLYVHGTGHEIPNDGRKYVGSAFMFGGSLVWHVYDGGEL